MSWKIKRAGASRPPLQASGPDTPHSPEVDRQMRAALAALWCADFGRAHRCVQRARTLEPTNPRIDVADYFSRALANDFGPHTWMLKARHRDMRTTGIMQYLLQRFERPLWLGQPIPAQHGLPLRSPQMAV